MSWGEGEGERERERDRERERRQDPGSTEQVSRSAFMRLLCR